ncbi:MAG: plasmid pRiA4b ORF-3 family protein [Solirubrobacteraceae bacterium]
MDELHDIDDLAATAAGAPTVARVRTFVDWVGAGRALTQTGRLRRVDALTLVELLDTGDVPDQRFPIQSSAELYHLTLLVEWAKACGLVRVARGRIVAVRKHAKLLEHPVELVCRMLAAIPQLAHELGHSVVAVDAVHTVEAVFADLVGHGGRLPLEHVCEVAWNTAMLRYEFPDATALQVEYQRRRSDGDVRRILAGVAGLGVLTVTDGLIALTALGSRSVGIWLGLGTPASDVLSVKVTLQDSADPEIWRRLRVPADIRLDRFHQVLGAAMGWQDSHLHVFEHGLDRYGFSNPDLDIRDDRGMTLGALVVQPGDRLRYEYDFGDSWEHEIVLEAVEQGCDCPSCTDGAGRCPPEDVGGIPGYEDLRRVLASPADDGHTAALEWLGIEHARDFDPVDFSVERANIAIAGVLIARSA